MTDLELQEMKSDLREIKEMMKVISKTISADKEIGAAQALKRLEDEKITRQIRKMAELAD